MQPLHLTPDLVARLPCRVEDPGPQGRVPPPDDYYAQVGADILARCPPEGLWVFAIGSIMWKRRFAVTEERCARVHGWHRKFCLGPDTRYRGNPDAPGVMLSLDRGGQCRGMALRMADHDLPAALDDLLRNEPPVPPAWVRAQTPQGEVRALAFVIRRDFAGYQGGLCEDEIADRLASSVGMLGSMAEYLCNTVHQMQAIGMHDAYLWRLQAMVAARLQRLPAAE